MLSLAEPTSPDWADRVLADLPELLVDHAHCEKKAAGMAVNLVFRYPQHGFLLAPLSRLAREELVHFEQLLAILAERGESFRILRPSPYAGRLRKATRTHEPARLVDTLLCCALIEARSCERFGLLAKAVSDDRLRAFYEGLLASEARHHGVYVELASEVAPRREVAARLAQLAELEARALADAPPLPRMHA
ncbi:MAG: tRNA-(ms[2]io[6]A)-hydroxylase [Myxococcota bacterium]